MLPFVLGLAALAAPAPAPRFEGEARTLEARTFRDAVLISVDGLRSDALIAVPASQLPGFTRLQGGASTLNARTDPDFTVTLPNHTGMITGRLVLGQAGHGWVENEDPPAGATIGGEKGAYVAGIFDVAHDRGWRTALFSGKTKFSLYDASWDGEHGAPDTEGTDQGRDKIDEFAVLGKTSEVADAVLHALKAAPEGSPGSLVFAHFAVTDLTAHAYGWDVTPGSKYMKAVGAVDAEIVRILDGIAGDEGLRGKTAIVLTADHGGGAPFKSHDQPRMWVDYVIPFVVWTGDGEATRDLYAINERSRRDPGLKQVQAGDAGLPPIRNADAGNVVMTLLGLPAIPGSTVDAMKDLAVFGPH